MSRVRNFTFYHALGRCQTQLAAPAIYHRHHRDLNILASPVEPVATVNGR